jgi:hypothetical protein
MIWLLPKTLRRQKWNRQCHKREYSGVVSPVTANACLIAIGDVSPHGKSLDPAGPGAEQKTGCYWIQNQRVNWQISGLFVLNFNQLSAR